MKTISLSVVLPIYNEEKALAKATNKLHKALKHKLIANYELILINDGSTDNSAKILKKVKRQSKKVKVLTHKLNSGYGSSLKTGIKSAKYKYIAIIDADGTYPANAIPELVKKLKYNDMVVGDRNQKGAQIPFIRIIPKLIILLFARLVSGAKIKDLNSGLRVFSKDLAMRYWHLYPAGFSFTSTITMAAHLENYRVSYLPIKYYKRLGQSSIKPYHFFYFLGLIARLMVYFKPMKFFFYPGIICSIVGFLWILITAIIYQNITDAGTVLFSLGFQITIFGLIADLIVKNREHYGRQIKQK
ncbi:MAG: glycosyltransferase family 2 protein [Patescibacteria group bacterium]